MISDSYQDLAPASHNVGGSNYHFVFVPKYRRKVFRNSQVKKACEDSFLRTAEHLGLHIHALEFGPDHCHLFVGNCRRYSVSKLAHRLKGASSYYVRQGHLKRIAKQGLYGPSFWSAGYFYESIGRVTTETVRYYIERKQGKHHEAAKKNEGQMSLDRYT